MKLLSMHSASGRSWNFGKLHSLWVAWLGVGERPGGCSGRVQCRLKDKGRRERERGVVRQVHNLAGLCHQPLSDLGQMPPLSVSPYHHLHHEVIGPDLSWLTF